MTYQFESDGLQLTGRLTKPGKTDRRKTGGLVLCHGFPSMSVGDIDVAQSYYDLSLIHI